MDRTRAVPGDSLETLEQIADAAMEAAEQGALAAADRLAAQAVALADRVRPSLARDRSLARAFRAHGTTHRARGRYREAERAFAQALVHARTGFGEITLEAAELENDLGMTFKFDGRFERAEEAYGRAHALLQAIPEVDQEDLAALLHNLGGLAHARGDFVSAEPFARLAIEVRSASDGHDELGVLLDRSAHAAILAGLGREAEAEAAIRDLLPDLERLVGPDHPEVAVALNNLAAIVQGHGDLTLAESLYRRVVTIKAAALGDRSPGLAVALNNLGTVLRRQGRPAEAADLYRRAIELLSGEVADDHPNLVAIRANLAIAAA